ncbi:centromere protein H-like [Bufo bufo]|uniref:centromere protein H-like n=1 Tax=Bufo bufo TaxID=8384 RepID=UPI001ABE5E48|nr:centromere protein H-like [Bufo bufo]
MSSRKKAAKRDVDRKHVPELFVQMRDTSVRCIESSLSCTHREYEDSLKTKRGSDSCMQLIRFGKQMNQQLMDMNTERQTRSLSKDDVDASLNVSLSIARVPLENEIWSVRNKELAIIRMQTFDALLNVLQKDATQCGPIMAVMNHSRDLCKQIMVLKQSNSLLEKQLVAIRKHRIETRIKQQELFQKLKYYEKTNRKLQDLETKIQDKGRETLQSVTHKTIIIQEVFQRLILSSQVNWAEDPHLKNLVLKMRDPLS